MLAFASLAGAAGQAMAATADFTLYQSDDPIVVFDPYILGIRQSQAGLEMSEGITTILRSFFFSSVSGLAPSLVSDEQGVDVFKVDNMPLASVGATVDTETGVVSLRNVRFTGGFMVDVPVLLPSGNKNSASTGGSLTLSDIKIDFTTQGSTLPWKGAMVSA